MVVTNSGHDKQWTRKFVTNSGHENSGHGTNYGLVINVSKVILIFSQFSDFWKISKLDTK